MNKVIALAAAILAQFYYICKTYLTKEKKKKLIGLIATLKVLSPDQLSAKIKANQSIEGL